MSLTIAKERPGLGEEIWVSIRCGGDIESEVDHQGVTAEREVGPEASDRRPGEIRKKKQRERANEVGGKSKKACSRGRRVAS